MLAKTQRFNLALKENQGFFHQAKVKHSNHLILFFLPSEKFQINAVVGKKLSGLAVERNRLRRQTFAAVEKSGHQPKLKGVLVIKRKFEKSREIEQEVKDLLS